MSSSGESSFGQTFATGHVDRAAALLRDLERDDRGAARPSQVGPYRIVELIGEGGMGEVYRAEQQEPIRRTVALKLIKLGMDSRHVVARFESERQTLAVMHHANVAAVYDAGITGASSGHPGRPYFVMEYVPGRPITEHCDEHGLDLRERLELFLQACEGVQHAHQKAVIHRDLKPSNILVTATDGKPVVKVIDFGVAKATGPAEPSRGQSAVTVHGQLLGTPEYMSPEQAAGTPDIDTRTDIYSLGVVLYELLSGARPFDGEPSRGSTFDAVRGASQPPDPPRPSVRLSSLGARGDEVARRRRLGLSDLTHTLRRELDWIPLKALRRDPAERYRTAAELADDVRNYLAARPLIAGPESRAYRLRKFVRRNRGAVLAVSAVVVALAVGLAVSGAMYRRAERLRKEAERNQIRADREAGVARDEAAKHAAVNSFLREMLGAANPRRLTAGDRAKGRDVTVLETIRQSIATLDAGSMKDQPDIEAVVRQTIGHTLKALGELDAAAEQIRKALAIREREHGPADAEVATDLNLLGMLAYDRGKYAEAESFVRRALDTRLNLYGAAPHADVAQGLNDLSNILSQQGKVAEAEPLQRRALVMSEQVNGANSSGVARCLINLGYLLQKQERFAEAEPLVRQGLELHRKLSGDVHPDVAGAYNNLASLVHAQHRLDEAEPLYRRALEIDQQLFGPSHSNVGTDLNNLATLLFDRGKVTDAEATFRESLELRRKVLGERHAHVGVSLNNLARVLRAQKRYPEAVVSYERALAVFRDALGERHPNVAAVTVNLGATQREAGDQPAAERTLRDAIRLQESVLPPGHWQRADAQSLLGETLCDQRKFAEAEPLLLGAVESLARAPAAAQTRHAEAVARIVKLYERSGRTDEAARWRTRSGAGAATSAPSSPIAPKAP